MEWEHEIYFVDNKYDVHRLKLISEMPEDPGWAMYYNRSYKICKVVDHHYRLEEYYLAFDSTETTIFVDRKEAYEYAKTKLLPMKKQIIEKIEQCDNRKWGYCITTTNGETKEHEIDECGL